MSQAGAREWDRWLADLPLDAVASLRSSDDIERALILAQRARILASDAEKFLTHPALEGLEYLAPAYVQLAEAALVASVAALLGARSRDELRAKPGEWSS